MKMASKKWLSLVTSLAVAFVMCFGTMTAFADEPASQDEGQQPAVEEPIDVPETVQDEDQQATESEPSDIQQPKTKDVTQKLGEGENDVVLTVVNKTGATESTKTFTDADLQAMATTKASYSAINNKGSVRTYSTTQGIPMATLMKKSGITMKDSYDINFITDKPGALRWGDLNATRYYYPNLADSNPVPGPINATLASKGKAEVKAVIAYDQDKLLFGQAYATEKNMPKFLDGVLAGGTIIVEQGGEVPACTAPTDEQASYQVGGEIESGCELFFHDYDSNKQETIYFTTNGKTPTANSAIYNFNPNDGEVNPIVIEGAGPITVKVLVKGFGRTDSEVKSFDFFVVPKLTVIDKTKKTEATTYFSEADLEAMATVTADYSAINNKGSVRSYSTTAGIPLATLMKKSGVTMKNSYEINFITDKPGAIRWGDLNATRYYYPNLEASNPIPGPINATLAKKGKKEVKAVIAYDQDKLLFGQAYATDKNMPKFLDGVLAGGTIIVEKGSAVETCKAPTNEQASVEVGSEVTNGTELFFNDYDSNTDETIYFTTNGKTPTGNSAIYNYNPKDGVTNPIVLEGAGPITVKVLVKGFGKTDSKVKSYKFFITPKLTVVNKTKKSKPKTYFSEADLEAMATIEATYSGFNNKGSFKEYSTTSGISIASLMKKSGITMKSSYKLTFDTDKTGALRWGDLNATRYYYPNLGDSHAVPGPIDAAIAKAGKTKVKAVISYPAGETSKLLFGQAYATEKVVPLYWDGIIEGGTINVSKGTSKKTWADTIKPNVKNGSKVTVGTEITFPAFDSNTDASLYYTTNGKTPTTSSAIYNYNPKDGVADPIVLEKTGKVTIKVREMGFGKKAGKVKTFTYKVVASE